MGYMKTEFPYKAERAVRPNGKIGPWVVVFGSATTNPITVAKFYGDSAERNAYIAAVALNKEYHGF